MPPVSVCGLTKAATSAQAFPKHGGGGGGARPGGARAGRGGAPGQSGDMFGEGLSARGSLCETTHRHARHITFCIDK